MKSGKEIPVVAKQPGNRTHKVVQYLKSAIDHPLDYVSSSLYIRTAGVTYNESGNYTCIVSSNFTLIQEKQLKQNLEVLCK